jgi:MFS family permease
MDLEKLMGLGYGGTSVIYSSAAADLFQGRHFGKILGLMEIGFGLGASLGSAIAGMVFDYFQTYRPAFYLSSWTKNSFLCRGWRSAGRSIPSGMSVVMLVSCTSHALSPTTEENREG